MYIYIKDNGQVKNIELKVWDNRANNGWSPDMFGDLADDLPARYPVAGISEAEGAGAGAAMTEQEYRDTVAWWEEQVRSYNAHEAGNWFVESLSCDEIESEYKKDLEYRLFAE